MTDIFGDMANILFNNGRSIGGVIPDVALSEKHNDTISITSHPVERGASIIDHAFVNPAQLNMGIGFFDCSLRSSAVFNGSMWGLIMVDDYIQYRRSMKLVAGDATGNGLDFSNLRIVFTVIYAIAG